MTTHPRVPYITAWSAETTATTRLVQLPDNRGIAYPDETLGDRDAHGILWKRTSLALGHGTPQFGTVHSARQRRAMRKLLCQVCAGPADQDDSGILWVLKDHRTDWPHWPNGMGVTEPPICAPCLTVSTRACPALRKGHAIIRTADAPLGGVHGTLYTPTPRGPQAAGADLITFTDPNRHWLLASNLVRELAETTILN